MTAFVVKVFVTYVESISFQLHTDTPLIVELQNRKGKVKTVTIHT
jgi:hypothetical protein